MFRSRFVETLLRILALIFLNKYFLILYFSIKVFFKIIIFQLKFFKIIILKLNLLFHQKFLLLTLNIFVNLNFLNRFQNIKY